LSPVSRAIRSFEYEPARGRFCDWLLVIARRRFARFQERRSRSQRRGAGNQELERIEDDRIEAE
jgi:DNA-directed RNA polymerase specialized sigma24 family protein